MGLTTVGVAIPVILGIAIPVIMGIDALSIRKLGSIGSLKTTAVPLAQEFQPSLEIHCYQSPHFPPYDPLFDMLDMFPIDSSIVSIQLFFLTQSVTTLEQTLICSRLVKAFSSLGHTFTCHYLSGGLFIALLGRQIILHNMLVIKKEVFNNHGQFFDMVQKIFLDGQKYYAKDIRRANMLHEALLNSLVVWRSHFLRQLEKIRLLQKNFFNLGFNFRFNLSWFNFFLNTLYLFCTRIKAVVLAFLNVRNYKMILFFFLSCLKPTVITIFINLPYCVYIAIVRYCNRILKYFARHWGQNQLPDSAICRSILNIYTKFKNITKVAV